MIHSSMSKQVTQEAARGNSGVTILAMLCNIDMYIPRMTKQNCKYFVR